MLSDIQRDEKKKQMLLDCLTLFVKQGLENTSINDLAKYCKTYKAAMYNYFKSKDEIVVEAAKMYMFELCLKLDRIIEPQGEELKQKFKNAFHMLLNEKENLRFVYQVISSPKYGDESRKELSDIYLKYLAYSELLAKVYKVSHDMLRPYFLLFVATVHDFCLWEDEKLAKEKLIFIYDGIEKLND